MAKFKVGDQVKYLGGNKFYTCADAGEIGIITNIDGANASVKFANKNQVLSMETLAPVNKFHVGKTGLWHIRCLLHNFQF